MKKLNNKGYMLIEIIIASVITFTIAFSLINLIIKFKDRNEDVYSETALLNDKINITKNIMNDLKSYTIVAINKIDNESDKSEKIVELKVTQEDQNEAIIKRLKINKNVIEYGDFVNDNFSKNKSYYKKTIQSFVEVGDPKINISSEENTNNEEVNDSTLENINNEEKILTLSIPINSIYSDKQYDIALFLKTKNIYKISYNDNLFKATNQTINGLTIEYEENEQIITLDGTTQDKGYLLGRLSNITFQENDKYIIKLKYISGDYEYTSTNNTNKFNFNFSKEGANIDNANTSIELPKKGTNIGEITYNLTEANGINFRYVNGTTSHTQAKFHNYKVQILISKEHQDHYIGYNEKYIKEGEELEIPSSRGSEYEFDGWYDEINGGQEIDENSDMLKTKDHTLYAHWNKIENP